jgi:hypothetical protein
MMDANTYYLNKHLAKEDEAEHAQDWKDDYVEELLAEGGEYYPFKPESLQEAIAELKLHEAILLSSYAHVAHKLPSQSSKEYLAEYLGKIVYDYWKDAAEKKADVDYNDHYQGRKYE